MVEMHVDRFNAIKSLNLRCWIRIRLNRNIWSVHITIDILPSGGDDYVIAGNDKAEECPTKDSGNDM